MRSFTLKQALFLGIFFALFGVKVAWAFPTEGQAANMLEQVCGDKNFQVEFGADDKIGTCQVCPSYTSNPERRQVNAVRWAREGYFTNNQHKDVLLEMEVRNCEDQSPRSLATVLLKQQPKNNGWKRIEYYRQGSFYNAQGLKSQQTGLDVLLVRSGWISYGFVVDNLIIAEVESDDIYTKLLFRAASNRAAADCGRSLYDVNIRNYFVSDINKDGYDDIVVDLSMTAETQREGGFSNDCARETTENNQIQAVLLNTKQGFRPDPKTAELIQKLKQAYDGEW